MCSIAIFHDILSVIRRSVNQGDTLLTRNIGHAEYLWEWNINEKEQRERQRKQKKRTATAKESCP